jgi:hypothetical protein
MNLIRRVFLGAGAVAAGGLLVKSYTEPLGQVAAEYKDWIEDKDDYCIIRVPDGKAFINERIDKNVILLLGAYSTFKGVDVRGYANIATRGPVSIVGCRFNARGFDIAGRGEAIRLESRADLLFSGNLITTNGRPNQVGVHFQ